MFRERLAPLRRLARTLIEKIQHPWFPVRPPTNKAESTLVSALDQITKAVPDSPIVQDDYSFRCFPQVQATAERTLWHVHEVVLREVNAATDNPLLFPPEPPGGLAAHSPEAYRAWLASSEENLEACREGVVGGGNFHGEPVACAMDFLAIGLAEVGSISERRVAHLVDDNHSRGLPPFLIRSSGLNSGFMIPQYTAAALVSENKVLAHPASVDSIPTCANTEDHVSMGTIAARKAADIVANVALVVAIELLAAWQGLTFRLPLRPGTALRQASEVIHAAGIEFYTDDRVMAPDLARMRQVMDSPALLDLVLDAKST
jgi:histidine ammonia-lyase